MLNIYVHWQSVETSEQMVSGNKIIQYITEFQFYSFRFSRFSWSVHIIGSSVLSWIGVLPPERGAPQPADKPVSTRWPARWPGQAQALCHWAHFGAAGGPHRWTSRNRLVCVWLPVCFHIHDVFIFFSTIKEHIMIHSKNLPKKYVSTVLLQHTVSKHVAQSPNV